MASLKQNKSLTQNHILSSIQYLIKEAKKEKIYEVSNALELALSLTNKNCENIFLALNDNDNDNEKLVQLIITFMKASELERKEFLKWTKEE